MLPVVLVRFGSISSKSRSWWTVKFSHQNARQSVACILHVQQINKQSIEFVLLIKHFFLYKYALFFCPVLSASICLLLNQISKLHNNRNYTFNFNSAKKWYGVICYKSQVEPVIIDEIGIALGNGPDGYRATFRNIEAFGVSNLTLTNIR